MISHLKSLGYFSGKGGTGKTSLAVTVGRQLALKGNNVCLLDLDLYGPSLYRVFGQNHSYWINDYLFGDIKNIEDYLVDYSKTLNLQTGKLFIGFSNPNSSEIEKMAQMDTRKAI